MSDSPRAYRVKVTVGNALLARMIEAAGYKSIAEAARATGVPLHALHGYVSLKLSPIARNGEFRPSARALMEAMGCAPHDLWTTEQLMMELERNSSFSDLEFEQVQALSQSGNYASLSVDVENPIDGVEQKILSEQLRALIFSGALTERQEHVIRRRFGIECDEATLEEVGVELGLSRQRVRNIQDRALRNLRHPSRSVKLRWGLDGVCD